VREQEPIASTRDSWLPCCKFCTTASSVAFTNNTYIQSCLAGSSNSTTSDFFMNAFHTPHQNRGVGGFGQTPGQPFAGSRSGFGGNTGGFQSASSNVGVGNFGPGGNTGGGGFGQSQNTFGGALGGAQGAGTFQTQRGNGFGGKPSSSFGGGAQGGTFGQPGGPFGATSSIGGGAFGARANNASTFGSTAASFGGGGGFGAKSSGFGAPNGSSFAANPAKGGLFGAKPTVAFNSGGMGGASGFNAGNAQSFNAGGVGSAGGTFGSSNTMSRGFAPTSYVGQAATGKFGNIGQNGSAFSGGGLNTVAQQAVGTKQIRFEETTKQQKDAKGQHRLEKYQSISYIPQFASKSSEELRFEDYKNGNPPNAAANFGSSQTNAFGVGGGSAGGMFGLLPASGNGGMAGQAASGGSVPSTYSSGMFAQGGGGAGGNGLFGGQGGSTGKPFGGGGDGGGIFGKKTNSTALGSTAFGTAFGSTASTATGGGLFPNASNTAATSSTGLFGAGKTAPSGRALNAASNTVGTSFGNSNSLFGATNSKSSLGSSNGGSVFPAKASTALFGGSQSNVGYLGVNNRTFPPGNNVAINSSSVLATSPGPLHGGGNGAVVGLTNVALGANGHMPVNGALQESKRNMDLMRKIAQNLTNPRDIEAKLPRSGGNISGGVSFDFHETAVIQPRSVRMIDNRRPVENSRSKSLFDSDAAAKVLSPSSFRRRSAKHFDENKITKDEKEQEKKAPILAASSQSVLVPVTEVDKLSPLHFTPQKESMTFETQIENLCVPKDLKCTFDSIDDISKVSNFCLEHPDYGKIEWLVAVNLTNVKINRVVCIKEEEICVYENPETAGEDKHDLDPHPQKGKGLNTRAKLTIKLKESTEVKDLEEYCKDKGYTHMTYNDESKEWTFLVPHFDD
jgi:hypothetical protein